MYTRSGHWYQLRPRVLTDVTDLGPARDRAGFAEVQMSISWAQLAITMVLYGGCVALTAWLLSRIKRRAVEGDELSISTAWRVGVEIAAVTILPVVVAVVLLLVPDALGATSTEHGDAGECVRRSLEGSTRADDLVLSERMFLCCRCPPARRWTVAVPRVRIRHCPVFALGAIALLGHSSTPIKAAELIAQVVGGILPLSAGASIPATFHIQAATGAFTVDWNAISAVRALVLCGLILISYFAMHVWQLDVE